MLIEEHEASARFVFLENHTTQALDTSVYHPTTALTKRRRKLYRHQLQLVDMRMHPTARAALQRKLNSLSRSARNHSHSPDGVLSR